MINTYTRKNNLRGSISQNKNLIDFYSCKLTPAQINYTDTEQELLSIAETSKKFRTILLGHRITVYK